MILAADVTPTFKELKRNLKNATGDLPAIRLAVVADSASQLLGQALCGYGIERKIRLELFDADYDQIDRQLLNGSSDLYQFQPEFLLIWHCTEKLFARFQKMDPRTRSSFAEEHLVHVRRLIDAVGQNCATKIIYCDFIEYNDAVFGNFATKVLSSWPYQVRRLNFELLGLAREYKNLFLNNLSNLAAEYGTEAVRDRRMSITASMSLSVEFLPVFAKNSVDIIEAITGRFKKCLVLDLDNTLWGGIIGDDGMDGIQVGDLGVGNAFSQLQRWAKQLKQRGVILAVSTKNELAMALEPFEKHPDMELRLDDIAVFQANWENKVDNIRHIQSILELGFDSMVFLDDNPVERALVRQALPEVCVPELPNDPVDWLPFLARLNLFETSSFIEEDQGRTTQYQHEARRREMKLGFSNEQEFLASLEMRARIEGFTPFNIPRVAQLILRSNQFNLRTIRYSDDEVRHVAASPDHVPLAFSLIDRFGDYGLVSVVILKRNDHSFFIDTWLMSCRVLRRGLEDLVLTELIRIARDEGLDCLVGEYIATAKNGLVKDHYRILGFEPVGCRWRLDVNTYRARPNQIRRTQP